MGMVDETITQDAIAVAPAVDTAASVPATETPMQISSTSAASSEAAPSSVEATPAEIKIETAVDGVLGAEPVVEKKPETKADAKTDAKAQESKTDTKSPESTSEPAEKPTLPTYEEFKLPEGVKLEKEATETFTKILGEIETGKLDHKSMQEKGQALIDLAAKNTVESINRLNDYYVDLHKQNVQKRVDALKADPELGGEKFENTVAELQSAVREYGGTEAQIAEFRKEITESGLSASPAVCRLIHNMQQKINKYTTEQNGPSIVPGAKPAPSKVKPYESFYSGNRA